MRKALLALIVLSVTGIGLSTPIIAQEGLTCAVTRPNGQVEEVSCSSLQDDVHEPIFLHDETSEPSIDLETSGNGAFSDSTIQLETDEGSNLGSVIRWLLQVYREWVAYQNYQKIICGLQFIHNPMPTAGC